MHVAGQCAKLVLLLLETLMSVLLLLSLHRQVTVHLLELTGTELLHTSCYVTLNLQ
jgi:hypothetical protein